MRLFLGYIMVLLVGLVLGTLIPSNSLPWFEDELGYLYETPQEWRYYENERFGIYLPSDFEVEKEYSEQDKWTSFVGPNLMRLEIYSGTDFEERPISVVSDVENQEFYDMSVPKGEIIYIDGDRHRIRFWHKKGNLKDEQLLYRIMSSFEDLNQQNFTN